jgi:transposase
MWPIRVFISKRRNFSVECKRGALEQAKQPDVSCAQVARELGIQDNLLTRWRREAVSQGATAFAGTGTPRDEELASSKRELVRVKKQRDSLREAATFFAKGSS